MKPSIKISIKVDRHVIPGFLKGSPKNWAFHSEDEFFLHHFPSRSASSKSYIEFLTTDVDTRSAIAEMIYNAIQSVADTFFDGVDYAFESNSYKELYEIAKKMSHANSDDSVSYVCAPVSEAARKAFREKYHESNTIDKFRPSLFQEFTLYQVRSSPVYNADEIEHEFIRLYDKSIVLTHD